MPNPLPNTLPSESILAAIEQFDAGVDHAFDDSVKFDLLHDGGRYPPKAIVGLAASALTGKTFVPSDFSGGEGSKCFRLLRDAGFAIALKPGDESPAAWLFQGSPKTFNIDDYVTMYHYVYWAAPQYAQQVQPGDRCFLWRSGEQGGLIARGQIVEPCKPMADANHPECLGEEFWIGAPEDRPQVGIQLTDVRLDRESGQIPRTVFKEHPLLKNSRIIRNPRGTVFPLTSDEVTAIQEFWNGETIQPSVSPGGEMEGERRLRMHYARERSRRLIEQKRNAFAADHDGEVFCELCGFNFAVVYPEELGRGFIEVHHIKPLAELDEARKTELSDIMLVCANCHRMIHRTRDAEANLVLIQQFFET